MKATQKLIWMGLVLLELGKLNTQDANGGLDLQTRWTGQPPSHETPNSVAQWLQNPFELKLEIAVTNLFADTNEYLEIIMGDQRTVFYGAGIDNLGQYIPTNYPPVEVEAIIRRDYQMSIMCPNSGPDGSPLFKFSDDSDPNNFGDLSALIATLSTSGSPPAVSDFLWTNFTAQAQYIFTNDDPNLDPYYLQNLRQTNLVNELNRIITSSSIYDSNRFAGVNLSESTANLLAQNPQGQDLVFLNRLLLHDAYGWSIPNGYDGSGTAQISLFVKPPTQYKISKNKPADKYSVLVNGPNSQQFDDGSAQINLQHPTDGYLSTNSAVIRVLKDKFGHYGIGDGCDDPRPAPGVGTWLKMGPGCTQDTNRISLDWSVSLGRTFDGLAIGRLSLREIELSRNSYTPYPLYYNAASTNLFSEVELVTTNFIVSIIATTNQVVLTTNILFNGNYYTWQYGITNIVVMETNADMVLRQVKAYQAFVDILTPDTNQTVLNFYFPGQVHTNKDEYGVYTNITGQPFVTWIIQNPEPTTANKLSIAQYQQGVCGMTNSLVKTSSGGGVTWTLTQGTGPETRVETRQVSFVGSPVTDRIEWDTIGYAGPSTPTYQCQETYHFYPWGGELVKTIIPNNPDLVTTYDYYDDLNYHEDYSFYGNGQLKDIIYPDGYWEKRVYQDIDDLDAEWMSEDGGYAPGLLRFVLHPRPDDMAGAATSPNAATPANSIYTVYGYSTGREVYSTFCELQGQDFHILIDHDQVFQTAPMGIQGAEDDIVYSGSTKIVDEYGGGTTTFKYADKASPGLAGHTWSQRNYGGIYHNYLYDHGLFDEGQNIFNLDLNNHLYTVDGYTNKYPDHRETDYYTFVEYGNGWSEGWWPGWWSSSYNYNGGDYYDYIEGHPTSCNGNTLNLLPGVSRKANRIYHGGSLVQTEDYSYLGEPNQWLLLNKTRYYVDSLGRATNVVIIDGATSRVVYTADYRGTSGYDGPLLLSETDENGQTKTCSYDSLQRLQTATIKGYGGQPDHPTDLTTNCTYDANGQLLSQTEQGGSLSSIETWGYDLANRMTNHSTSSGGSITTGYSADGMFVTNIYPGGITVIQGQNQARLGKTLQGNGVVSEYYDYNLDSAGLSEVQSGIGAWGCPIPGTGTVDDSGSGSYMISQLKTTHKGHLGSSRWQIQAQDKFNNHIAWQQWPIGKSLTNVGWLVYVDDDTFGYLTTCFSSDGVSTNYDYDSLGAIDYQQAVDNSADYSGEASRITFSDKQIIQINGAAYQATTNYILLGDGEVLEDSSSGRSVQSIHLEQLNGFTGNEMARTKDYDADNNETITTTYVDRANNKTTTVTSQPNTSILEATTVYQNGLPISSSTLSVANPTLYSYDDLGWTNLIQDPQGFFSIINYDPNTGWITSVTDPAGHVTSYQYYGVTEANAGKLKCQISANGKKTYYDYTTRGELHHTWGDVPYPAEYNYSEYGDLTNLITFRGGSSWSGSAWPGGTGDNTFWIYDEASGALLQKIDALGNSVTYTYNTNTGRLLTRTWARTFTDGSNNIVRVTVTNSYNGFGDLVKQEYNDGTPNVYLNNYNRAGLPCEIVDGSGTSELTYDHASRLVTSTCISGLLNGITVSNHFNPYYGRDAVAVLGLLEDDYGYDTYGRLNSVSSGNYSASYGYVPNSDLLQSTTFSNNSTTVLTTTRTWDYGMRLRSIANVMGSAPVTSHSYQYDALNRRTQATLEDGSYWSYGYDDRDELTGAKRNWSYYATSTPVSGQQFSYAYDNIGNRQTASFGGDQSGAGLWPVSYAVNSLNQYTSIVTPGIKDILGAALATNSVTVNGGVADRHGEYFHRQISVANTNQPVWQNVTNISGTFTNKGGLVFPANSQTLVYDADGNLSFDGVWNYQWDGENRLLSMMMTNVSGIADSNRLKLDFAYDFRERRVQKIVSIWNSSSLNFQPSTTNLFVYDGWNLLAIINPQSSIRQSFMWGNDLSGTMTKAGGVGGLLMVSISGTNYFVGYGGSGNITALINAVDKSTGARYEYSPYGELIRATGLYAHQNPFRFSTKYWDDETGLLYNNYRYYDPIIGKWIGRDPLKDKPILHLYLFCHNNPLNRFDTDGRDDLPECLIALNCASSLDAAYSGATPFIADGVFQLIASLGTAVNSANAYICAYAATAGILLCNNENLIFDASSLTLGFATHPGPGGPGAGNEFCFKAGELLYEMSEQENNPSAAYGMGEAEVDYIDPNTQ